MRLEELAGKQIMLSTKEVIDMRVSKIFVEGWNKLQITYMNDEGLFQSIYEQEATIDILIRDLKHYALHEDYIKSKELRDIKKLITVFYNRVDFRSNIVYTKGTLKKGANLNE